jgi:hypothetical protein
LLRKLGENKVRNPRHPCHPRSIDGNKIPVTGNNGTNGQNGTNGSNGITPQLRIDNITNYWEVSYDNGANWTSLGIKATGENGTNGTNGTNGQNGTQGPQGDAIFAANGINNSNPDYVEFTLADGTTKIRVPNTKHSA